MIKLVKLPCFSLRCKAVAFELRVNEMVTDIQRKIDVVKSTCRQIMTSKRFIRLLQFVLAFGNFLNFGTAKGYALGFRITALLKLSEVKAVDQKTTLLHFLVNHIEENDIDCLKFSNEMSSLPDVINVSVADLNDNITALVKDQKLLDEAVIS
eukprot:19783_4